MGKLVSGGEKVLKLLNRYENIMDMCIFSLKYRNRRSVVLSVVVNIEDKVDFGG